MYFIQEKKVPNLLLVGLCGIQVILARYNTFVDLNNLVFMVHCSLQHCCICEAISAQK